MKKLMPFLVILTGILISCTKDECTQKSTYKVFTPVWVLPEEFTKPAEIAEPRELKQPGKIYFYNDYILINEVREGIHLINNSDPANPVNKAFIRIKGNVDMAVRNGILYADSYTDLVIIDIRDVLSPVQIERKAGVFTSHYHREASGAVLSHYLETEETVVVDCSDASVGHPWIRHGNGGVLIDVLNFDNLGPTVGSNASGAPELVGQGGSMARFTISKGHLYAIGDHELYAFEILSDGRVSFPVTTMVQWGIETIFPYKDILFVGANNGLHILRIENPLSPVFVSTFNHAMACDPVVVQGDIAYVTLRDGTECRGFVNQLDIIDVKDIFKPKLLYSHPMKHPHGLAVEGDFLYLCEGSHGLKVFNISDPAKVRQNQVQHIVGLHAWDAIALKDKSLLVIGDDGFRQYDKKDPAKLKALSKIEVKR
jgi:hypothetical protein